MFYIADKYIVNKKIAMKTFLVDSLKPAERGRLRKSLKKVVLTHQIAGEEIPSLINDEYNCTVILFLDVELDKISSVNFVSNIMQKLIKSPCILRFYDETSQVYSFAHKRINLQDKNEVVIENTVISDNYSLAGLDDKNIFLEKVLNSENIKNRVNKKSFYFEMMAKAFVAENSKLFAELKASFDNPIWYDANKTMDFLEKLKTLKVLKQGKNKIYTAKEQIQINTQIKELIEDLKNYL